MRSVKSTVSELEDNKVKLLVEVDASDFEPEVDAAFKRIAREVNLPGFRPGKVPRKLLEQRLGPGVAREEALREALPGYYAEAVREHDVDVIDQPEIDITEGQEGGDVVFEAVVEVRPIITVAGYDSLRVEVPSPDVSDEEIDEYIDRLRTQFADVEPVERPAEDEDQVTIDIACTHDGEEVPGLNAEDYAYPLGMGAVVPELDENLRGASAGDELSFEAEHPDPETDGKLEFSIVVKEVQAKVLPEVDDDFVAEATEFTTVDELRNDLTTRMGATKKMQTQMALQNETATALAQLVDTDVPDALINAEMQGRIQDFAMRLQQQGMQLDQYLQLSGTSTEDFTEELREGADEAVRVDLALRAVVVAENIESDEAELDAEIAGLAGQLGEDVDTVRERLEHADQIQAVRSDLQKRRALEWLVDQAEIVDPDGNPIDKDDLDVRDEAESDADENAEDSDSDSVPEEG